MGFCVQLGNSTEWSLACPGMGIAVDWSALLTFDLAGDVVAGASLVGPAGTMPIGLESGVMVTVVEGRGFGIGEGTATGEEAEYALSLHPVVSNAIAKTTCIPDAIGLLKIMFMPGYSNSDW